MVNHSAPVVTQCCGIDFNADPGPAFYLNADPDPESLTNADPGQTLPLNLKFYMQIYVLFVGIRSS